MPFELIIVRYGLAAVGLGAAIEGETAVVAGGVLAHQQLVSVPGVLIAAALGSFVADKCFFSIGRHFRDRSVVQRLLAKPAAAHAISLLSAIPIASFLRYGFSMGYGRSASSPLVRPTSPGRASWS